MKKKRKDNLTKEEILTAQRDRYLERISSLLREAGYQEDQVNTILQTIKSFTFLDKLVGDTTITERFLNVSHFQQEFQLNKEQSEKMARLVYLLIKKEIAIFKM